MVKKLSLSGYFLIIGAFLVFGIAVFFWFNKPNEDNFKAPGRNWNSLKKVM